MKPEQIAVILLNWNGKKDTLECLYSLQKVSYPHFTTVVVDNGSSDDSVQAIRENFPSVPVLETKENLGFAGGNNVAIQWALGQSFEWLLLLNNDTTVSPDFLDAFLKTAHRHPKGKIFGAKIYRYDNPLQIDHLGGFWDPKKGDFFSPYQGKIEDNTSFETEEKTDYVCGACLLMHRSVPETIGLLEPRFFLLWEETDFCFRAQRQGFEVWIAPQAKIWHKVSASFSGGKPHMHYFWWRSRLLWIERNCGSKEKRQLYYNVILPDLWKVLRHYLLRSLQNLFTKSDANRKVKQTRYRAALSGVFHYAIGRFGNCPHWLLTKR